MVCIVNVKFLLFSAYDVITMVPEYDKNRLLKIFIEPFVAFYSWLPPIIQYSVLNDFPGWLNKRRVQKYEEFCG